MWIVLFAWTAGILLLRQIPCGCHDASDQAHVLSQWRPRTTPLVACAWATQALHALWSLHKPVVCTHLQNWHMCNTFKIGRKKFPQLPALVAEPCH